ncbi:hypothetical protein NDU88_003100 [Pleurodeles waltl]|uniref:Uncharacterized protein n=1 Tax=Pleurodeles waltl TaxID=8319 RepID=A0AAV7LR52_PLEWA|nr:hypothetical protein NDU88_003100 [Pleurodeles waltl]
MKRRRWKATRDGARRRHRCGVGVTLRVRFCLLLSEPEGVAWLRGTFYCAQWSGSARQLVYTPKYFPSKQIKERKPMGDGINRLLASEGRALRF